jgi:5'-phosphate synthase pdxT subunit
LRIGVLALQGAVREHLEALRCCGVEAVAVRTPEQVAGLDGLVLPGGESTTIGKLMDRYGLLEPVRALARSGKPLLGTCAGMILMAKQIEAGVADQLRLSVMDITVKRNAFGRQVESFESDLEVRGLNGGPVRGVFIRAPLIESVGPGVEVLAEHEGTIVAARQERMLALSFHPELTDDLRIHRYFLSLATPRSGEVLSLRSTSIAGGS